MRLLYLYAYPKHTQMKGPGPSQYGLTALKSRDESYYSYPRSFRKVRAWPPRYRALHAGLRADSGTCPKGFQELRSRACVGDEHGPRPRPTGRAGERRG